MRLDIFFEHFSLISGSSNILRSTISIRIQIAALLPLLLALGSCSNTPTYNCDFSDTSPKPNWINGGTGYMNRSYIGVGVSGRVIGGPHVQMKLAQDRAIESASQSIVINISTNTTTSLESNSSSSSSNYTQSMNHVSQQISKMLVKNSSITDKWLDSEGCYYWVRVEIKESEVNKVIHERKAALSAFSILQSKIRTAANKSFSMHTRKKSIATGLEMIDSIDFYLLQQSGITPHPENYYASKLNEIKNSIEKTELRETELEKYKKVKAQYLLAEKHFQMEDFTKGKVLLKQAKAATKKLNREHIDTEVSQLMSQLDSWTRKFANPIGSLIAIGDSYSRVSSILETPNEEVSTAKKGVDCISESFLFGSCIKYARYIIDRNGRFASHIGDLWYQYEGRQLRCIIHENGFEIWKRGEGRSGDRWTYCDNFVFRHKNRQYYIAGNDLRR